MDIKGNREEVDKLKSFFLEKLIMPKGAIQMR